ncbi:MAG: hypothetical protein CMI55_01655 [Parcubacteria group bacterium]|nr:hypothetical protein [Parcubacteria group bacterium]
MFFIINILISIVVAQLFIDRHEIKTIMKKKGESEDWKKMSHKQQRVARRLKEIGPRYQSVMNERLRWARKNGTGIRVRPISFEIISGGSLNEENMWLLIDLILIDKQSEEEYPFWIKKHWPVCPDPDSPEMEISIKEVVMEIISLAITEYRIHKQKKIKQLDY